MTLRQLVHCLFLFCYITPSTYLHTTKESLHFPSSWIKARRSVEEPYYKLWIAPRMPELVPRSYEWIISSNHWTTSLSLAQGWTGTLYTSTCRSRNTETSFGYNGWHVPSSWFYHCSRWTVGDWNPLAFLYALSNQKTMIGQLSEVLSLLRPKLH